MHFETVFDVAQVGYMNWRLPAGDLVLVAVSAFLVFFPRLSEIIFSSGGSLGNRLRRPLAWTFFIFSLAWTLVAFVLTLPAYIVARNALVSGQYTVIEGVVTDFQPMPYTGHAVESFSVAGQRFSYSDYLVTGGFNKTRSHGGPIDQGVYVRVAHKGNLILRLEVAR